MHIKDELIANRERFMTTLVKYTQNEGSKLEDTKQFVAGFLHLVTSAASGDLAPRDNYLDTVIPAIKQGGMPLSLIVTGMVQVGMALSAEISADNRDWIVKFVSDYSTRLIQRWDME